MKYADTWTNNPMRYASGSYISSKARKDPREVGRVDKIEVFKTESRFRPLCKRR